MLRLLRREVGFRKKKFQSAAVTFGIPPPSNGWTLAATGRERSLFSSGGVGLTTTLGSKPWHSAGFWGVFTVTRLVSMTPRKEADDLCFRSTAVATTNRTMALGVQIQEADGRFGKMKPFREIAAPLGLEVWSPINLVIGARMPRLDVAVRIPINLKIGAKKLLGGPESSSCKMEAIRLCLDPMEFIKPVDYWKSWPPVICKCWPESVARTPAVRVKSPDKNPLGFEVKIPISPEIGARKLLGCRYNSDICKRRAATIFLGPTEVIKPVVDWESQPPVFHSGWPEKVARLPSLLMQFPDTGGCKAARVWKWAWVLGPELNFKPIDVTV